MSLMRVNMARMIPQMRHPSRAFCGTPLLAAALLCLSAPAHAGMLGFMDRAFTFREEQKPLVIPHHNSVPNLVYQPHYSDSDHVAWSEFYTRPDLEPQDYLSNSASKVMRPADGNEASSDEDTGGWQAINARGNTNQAAADADVFIGRPGEGPGMQMGDANVGVATKIGAAVKDWRDDSADAGNLASRPGDYDYRMADIHRPALEEDGIVRSEALPSNTKKARADLAASALSHDKRYVSFNADGQVTAYMVQKGDTLGEIAAQPAIYGKTTLWPLIYSANRQAIGASPANLKVKQTLTIPRNYSDAQARDAEKRAAKKR
ncbi:MAG: hypothetical protein GC129_01250 [Proteobacteria bacterium]|nr:hypothetical protein [Pseudomonadota bacterium]